MGGREFSASPGAVKELLQGGGECVAPQKILSERTEAQANRQVFGSPATIAQIVAHRDERGVLPPAGGDDSVF